MNTHKKITDSIIHNLGEGSFDYQGKSTIGEFWTTLIATILLVTIAIPILKFGLKITGMPTGHLNIIAFIYANLVITTLSIRRGRESILPTYLCPTLFWIGNIIAISMTFKTIEDIIYDIHPLLPTSFLVAFLICASAPASKKTRQAH